MNLRAATTLRLRRVGRALSLATTMPIRSSAISAKTSTCGRRKPVPPVQMRPLDAGDPVPCPARGWRRWHLQTFGCTADGRVFRGARGGPLSESLYGRIWHQAPAAAIPGQAGTWPARRPYDLRHAALSLWLSSSAPAAEVAARAGHSVRVLLTIYAHCMPGCDQIGSLHIEQALRPSPWPPAGPQQSAQTSGIPSVMRPCHSWTQWDTAGPETSAQIGYTSVTCGNIDR
jgi:hypothetical protein